MKLLTSKTIAVALCLLLAGACGGSSSNGGAAGSAGAAGQGGTSGLVPRACDPDVACEPGATCTISTIETTIACACDPSGHLLCDTLMGGAAGPSYVCLPGEQCPLTGAGASGDSCTSSNAFCTRSCDCKSGQLDCATACAGPGPEKPGRPCDLSSCSPPSFYGCTYKSGACDYQVTCTDQQMTGVCP